MAPREHLDVLLTTLFVNEDRLAERIDTRSNTLGLAYLKSALKPSGATCKIVDPFGRGLDLDGTVQLLGRFSPRVCGISATMLDCEDLARMVPALRQIYPESAIVVGGYAGFLYAQLLSEIPEIDYVVVGEGEVTFHELVSKILEGQATDGTLGVADRSAGQIRFPGERPPIADLDELPSPDVDDLGLPVFGDGTGRSYVDLETSRGCPRSCHFCSIKMMTKGYRRMSPGRVADHVHHLCKRYPKVAQVAFCDSFFDLRRFVVHALRDRGLGDLRLILQTSVPNLKRHWRVLEPRDRARMIECFGIGLESMSDEQLREYGKGTTVRDNWQAVKILCGLRIAFRVNVIVDRTLDRLRESLPYYWHALLWRSVDYCTPLRYIPGTVLHRRFESTAPKRWHPWHLAFTRAARIAQSRRFALADALERLTSLADRARGRPGQALGQWKGIVQSESRRCEGMIVQLMRDNLLRSFDVAEAVEAGDLSYGSESFNELLRRQETDFKAKMARTTREIEASVHQFSQMMGLGDGWTVLRWSSKAGLARHPGAD